MTRAVAQTPSDLVLSSTTESQEAIDHAVSENWKEPFIPAAEKEAADKTAKEAAEKAALESETPEQKAAREAEEAEHTDETPEERAQRIADEAEPVKGNWSKRVNKLTARNARIQEELLSERTKREDLERRLASLERGERPNSTERVDNASQIADLPGKPKRIDFKDEETYVSALIKYERANEDYKEQQTEWNEHSKRVFEAHRVRVIEARERYDDWDEVAKAAEKMVISNQAQFAINELPNSADVYYFLATHPEAYAKLAAMSPSQQVIEGGRVSDKLLAGSTNGNGGSNGRQRKVRSAAPEPITPGGRRPTAQGKKLDDMTTEEYISARRAQRAARRAN